MAVSACWRTYSLLEGIDENELPFSGIIEPGEDDDEV